LYAETVTGAHGFGNAQRNRRPPRRCRCQAAEYRGGETFQAQHHADFE